MVWTKPDEDTQPIQIVIRLQGCDSWMHGQWGPRPDELHSSQVREWIRGMQIKMRKWGRI